MSCLPVCVFYSPDPEKCFYFVYYESLYRTSRPVQTNFSLKNKNLVLVERF